MVAAIITTNELLDIYIYVYIHTHTHIYPNMTEFSFSGLAKAKKKSCFQLLAAMRAIDRDWTISGILLDEAEAHC